MHIQHNNVCAIIRYFHVFNIVWSATYESQIVTNEFGK